MGLTMRDVARFGPKAQRQLLEKCAAAQVAGQAKENKYHARAERVVLPDGSVRVFGQRQGGPAIPRTGRDAAGRGNF